MRSQRFPKYFLYILIITILLMGCGAPVTPESSPESISQPSSTPAPSDTPALTDTPLPTSSPAPTDTPEPTAISTLTFTPTPVTIRLEADGSGDYDMLEEAVRSAPEGATIELGAGVFLLEDNLTIDKTLSLVGQGMDGTEIVSSVEKFVVYVTGGISFSAEGITFRYEGNTVADVLEVESGEVTINNCRFTGAVFNKVERIGGAGLRLGRDTSGLIQDCVSEENGIGIAVSSKEIILKENTARNNLLGIGFGSDSAAIAQRNLVSENQLNGIRVVENAKPILEDNVITGNGANGIEYIGNGGGTASQNECSKNGMSGIAALDHSEPIIESNTSSENRRFGLVIADNSNSEVRRNQVLNNQFSGILIAGEAQAFLEENVCNENVKVGIFFRDNSSGTAIHNQCIGNSFGIFVDDTANPELVENDCHDNKVADIKDGRE